MLKLSQSMTARLLAWSTRSAAGAVCDTLAEPATTEGFCGKVVEARAELLTAGVTAVDAVKQSKVA
ncbi:hypothetical protein [Algihabitans sp.]|uniref:hypothetical protein n=1 Tax=Algihabitans sp. TaxID=2821514 RepID=UPI003BACADB4